MKNTLFYVAMFFLLIGCSVKKKPIFKKVDAIKIIAIDANQIWLKAVAIFENPNDVGGKISTDNLKVYINDLELAKVYVKEFKIPAKKNFLIPLEVVIETKDIFKSSSNDVFGGLLNSLLNNSIKVRFKGDLTYKIFDFSYVYRIDTTQKIKF